MTDIYFYHLERQPVDVILPQLLEKALERGWRAVVQVGVEERVEALSTLLWTYREDSFLAHGTVQDGRPTVQPIWLTAGTEAPNGAQARFFVDGAEPAAIDGLERVAILFDGTSPPLVERARELWRELRAHGHVVSYWRQDERGRWRNIAENDS